VFPTSERDPIGPAVRAPTSFGNRPVKGAEPGSFCGGKRCVRVQSSSPPKPIRSSPLPGRTSQPRVVLIVQQAVRLEESTNESALDARTASGG